MGDPELEAMIAASAVDLAIKTMGGDILSMAEWNDIVVPRAGMIRRWIRTQAGIGQVDATEPQYIETGEGT